MTPEQLKVFRTAIEFNEELLELMSDWGVVLHSDTAVGGMRFEFEQSTLGRQGTFPIKYDWDSLMKAKRYLNEI